MELRKGQKVQLNENLLTVRFERNSGAVEIDTAAFLQTASPTVAEEDFIFYGNAIHNSGGVIHNADDSISIDLSKIPKHIEKISFTATIYDAAVRKQNFSKISGASLKIINRQGVNLYNFALESFTSETAIVLGEIYRYKDSWKFNAVGAGFYGGLAALCKNFGIEVTEEMSAPSQPTPPPKIIIPPPTKIELQKGQKINIKKKSANLGEILINLNWAQPTKSGVLGRFKNSIDLDLACLYELKDGEIGAIQALGNYFGDLNYPPYIALDGDDRTGSVAGGENLRINGKYIDKISRILIFTFIYSGAANWQQAKGVVTVKCPGNPDLIVRMDEYGFDLPTCAIALLENIGETFCVEKIVNFYYDSKQMDEDFDWGLTWTRGSK